MSEAGGTAASTESPGAQKPGAAKDRSCPYCGQAFTSSSLGRHLDLYIKEKNPKPPDGIHDVDAIRKMRGGITRRQPRGSLARQDASTPSTPTGSTTIKSPVPEKLSSSIPKDGQYVVDQAPKYPLPWQPTWEATGVMNDLPARHGELAWDENSARPDDARRQSAQQRGPSRMAQKQQLDAKQKLSDAVDTARAAELALRELLSSWRAAKQEIDMNSLPFDFDPLALDFPALTLQCLQPPPTLFSSIPHPNSTSWSIQPPAQKQFDALNAYFLEEFRKWRVTCTTATTAASEELTYPPSQTHLPLDVRESVKKAEKAAAALEKQINEHLQSTYAVWDQLPPQRQHELWTLELARSVGRIQKDVEKLNDTQHSLKQENANLKTQIDQLNRLQQPREFRIMPPSTVPFDQSFVSYVLEFGLRGHQRVALNMDDRHVDLTTLVSRAIERWKNVIVSSRVAGMGAQKSLDQHVPTPAPAPNRATSTPIPPTQPRATHNQQIQPRQTPAAVHGPSNESRSTTTTSVSAVNDENSDEDADAEMEDDDSFPPVSAPAIEAVAKAPQPALQKLQVARSREHAQRNNSQFTMNGAGNVGVNRGMNVARPVANMTNIGMQGQGQRGQPVMKNDYGQVVQGVSNGDPMYMD
ncbi:hypothetical protein BJ170DRAFT_269818 [Xylariales sp. AK1849]|nr:hypothetical protein BJ170DRAFT_269818 [Xylariales sp. AK1849]